MPWHRFKALCQQRFGPPLRSNTLGEVARLPFCSTVEAYRERFLVLLCHTEPTPPPHQQAHLFTTNLPGRLHVDVDLVTLLDTGSNHNFINTTVAVEVTLPFSTCRDLLVTVANGDRVPCPGRADNVPLEVASEPFSTSFYTIPLGGFDVVLGIAFLCTLGPILWDFDQLCLSFRRQGCRMQWRGIRLVPQSMTALALTMGTRPLLEDLLDTFLDMFAAPTGLPPARVCDHRIYLRPGAPPIAVRPYRYVQLQKDELKCQVGDMLVQGIIHPSTSAFLAPILLVKKHDASWCFCINYRALNDAIVKDKFPIPVVDELLNELHGACFFTKLDLRSGHHQVHMHVEDIEKTTFCTHHGHFEFLAHLQHIKAALETLRGYSLFVKRSKCSFGTASVAYLGHVTSEEGIAMHMDKVEAVTSWPRPCSTRGLRGFLDLAGYYRKFIKDFGLIAAPLTALLRKDAFHWSSKAEAAFIVLKQPLSTAPVLQLPDFDQLFIVKCDALGTRFSVVLHQVWHWRPYLLGRRFLIRTDHFSLKFLLDQRLSTIPQHHWMSKLFGYDFSIEYRPGCLNAVADALSHRDADTMDVAHDNNTGSEAMATITVLSGPTFHLYTDLAMEAAFNSACARLREQIALGTLSAPWREHAGLLLHGSHVFVPSTFELLPQVLQLAHADHEGIQKTLHRLQSNFYIEHDRGLVRDYVRACEVWADIAMDFMEGLPWVHGKSVILTVVDHFSKYAHFIALGHPYMASFVASAFFTDVVRLHGLPTSIVSDRDSVFTSAI
ncbi:hypothetical protein U9M48_030848 [Paspalum notatum var. saurae]|uniref:Integrase catalytic domain-containing protein n=1 Tax=Paspalum notatum var. saurae TaxID=547442 RepID=A0AAQ3X2P8_PASNO